MPALNTGTTTPLTDGRTAKLGVVIVDGGFGGLYAAKALSNKVANVHKALYLILQQDVCANLRNCNIIFGKCLTQRNRQFAANRNRFI